MSESRVIDLIYDSIVSDEALAALPELLAEHMRCEASWIVGDVAIDLNADMRPTITAVHGIDEDVGRDYTIRGHRIDPWMQQVGRIECDRPFSLARLVSEAQFRASDLYNDVLRGRLDVAHCMVLMTPVGGTHAAYSLLRGSRLSAFDEDDETRLAPLSPHLVRMLRARDLRRRNGIVGPTPYDAALLGADPVVVCDDDARIIHCNVPAVDLIARCTAIRRSPSGRLEVHGEDFNLHAAIRNAIQRGIPCVRTVTVGSGRYVVRIDPECPGGRCCIVTVRDVLSFVLRKIDAATIRFRFTPAERALALSLVTGLSVEAHAASRRLKMPTVRTQMSALLAKAGVERQPQLVAAIMECPTSR